MSPIREGQNIPPVLFRTRAANDWAMLVKDGVIQKMFVEPQKPGDPFEVSDADTMLAYVAPKAKKAA